MSAVPVAHRAKKLAIHLGADAGSRVASMLARQNTSRLDSHVRDLACGTIGCLGGAPFPERGNIGFFTGCPIHGPDIREWADADAATRLFAQFDGAFAGVFWDARRQVLIVATDCLGMQPLYLRHDHAGLTLVSETKALCGEPDPAAWGAFLSLGHPIGGRSLMHGLRRVPPASILTYDCASQRLDIRRYWPWPDPSDAWRQCDFLAMLERDIRACVAFGNPGTLLLSGGFDSRLLLFLLRHAGVPAKALIVAHADEHGDADGRLAGRVATLAGMPFRRAVPEPGFFSSRAYLDYLRASDVGHPSLDLFIARVASQIDDSAVWDGLVPGFVFMPLHQPTGGFDAYRQQEVRGPGSAIWRAASRLFKPEVVAAMADGFTRDLDAEMSRLPADEYGLARFVIENRSRNRAAMNPLKVYANHADAFTPGLSRDFMTAAATIPLRVKRGGDFYRSLFAQLDERALSIPILSGGELMQGARRDLRYRQERARIAYHSCRSRHPRLFPGPHPRPLHPSRFLGEWLFEGDDYWLDPEAGKHLAKENRGNHLAWKLLFHWKAWQWVHDGQLEARLGFRAIDAAREAPDRP